VVVDPPHFLVFFLKIVLPFPKQSLRSAGKIKIPITPPYKNPTSLNMVEGGGKQA
jgi:hypothetical protein